MSHLIRHVLSESHLAGINTNLQHEFVDATEEIADRSIGDDTLNGMNRNECIISVQFEYFLCNRCNRCNR